MERSPNNGTPEPQDYKTTVKVLYNDRGTYFGVKMIDPNPENIKKQLTERDDIAKTMFS